MKPMPLSWHWLPVLALPFATHVHATCLTSYADQMMVKSPYTASATVASNAQFWDASAIYNAGARVQANNGLEYEARWWTQGNAPASETGEVWKLLPDATGALHAWQSSQVYYVNERTVYQGKVFSAKWWTKNNTPNAVGSDWSLVPGQDFSKVTLSGYGSKSMCSAPGGSTQYSQGFSWSITQDPAQVIAYWKVMDYSGSVPVETARGTSRSGTVSGVQKTLFLCSAGNFCGEVLLNWRSSF